MRELVGPTIESGRIGPKTVGAMFFEQLRLKDLPAFGEPQGDGNYRYRSWNELCHDVAASVFSLRDLGIFSQSRVGFIASNNYQRLVLEMAVMSMGAVAVPIFIGYGPELLSELVAFSELDLLVVENSPKLSQVNSHALPSRVLVLGPKVKESLSSFGSMVDRAVDFEAFQKIIEQTTPGDLALIMYTSGTTKFPKGVMLTHGNIMSQQQALQDLWAPKEGMKFLCYLPWHHSFGGLFERFFALSSGGCLAIDDSWGKDIDRLFANFQKVQPNVYFSVPKVYQEIVGKVLTSERHEKIFFHPGLKFVFTAAAPLPMSISDIFKQKKIPVVEGWGLTETSPCCTLTSFSLERKVGYVGFPIPGVEVRLADQEELLVRGPNVMRGYFRSPELTREILTDDGWFHTGDVGEISEAGVRIVSRKDRIFKLSNGEKVFPAVIEDRIQKGCKFVKYVYIFGSGLKWPVALLFPAHELVAAKEVNFLDGSFCENPCSLEAYAGCLKNCLNKINRSAPVRFEKIGRALLLEHELSLDRNELTPSFKLIPRAVEKNYSIYLEYLLAGKESSPPKGSLLISLDNDLQGFEVK